MTREETGQAIRMIDRVTAGRTLVIIEHDMDVVFRFAREITVMVQGAVFTHGTPDEIMKNEDVKAVYLGQEGHDAAARGGQHG
jgi:branched-chain amino acid transport system ATP-binding protein